MGKSVSTHRHAVETIYLHGVVSKSDGDFTKGIVTSKEGVLW